MAAHKYQYRKIIEGLGARNLGDQLQRYYEANVPPSFGETPSSILSTDLSNQYIVMLVGEIFQRFGEKNMVSSGIFTTASPSGGNFEEQAELLARAYAKAKDDDDVEGVYTVWGANAKNKSHQNWLYFDIKENKIIRLEPNGRSQDIDWGEFRMGDFMDLLARKTAQRLGRKEVAWELALDEGSINNFEGCRATSTILATLHIFGIDFEEIRRIEGTDRNPDSIKALAFILQKTVNQCNLKIPPEKRTRSGPKELTLIAPEQK